MTIHTYGEHQVDRAKLPEATVHAIFNRGLVHFLGNEQASKVTNALQRETERLVKEFEAEAKRPATDEEKEQFRDMAEGKRAELKASYIEAALKAMNEGTIGVGRSRGPAADPIEVEMERFAKAEVKLALQAHGIKVPKGDEAVQFADGTKLTMDDLVDRWMTKNGDKAKAHAEKVLRDKAKKAEQARKNAAAVQGPKTAEALGF